MKAFLFILLSIMPLLSLAQSRMLTLSECIDYALQNSNDIQDYDKQISTIDLDIKNEKKKFLPSISAKINNGLTSGFQQVFSESMAGQYKTVRAYSNNVAIDISMPIWTANAQRVMLAKQEIEQLSRYNQKFCKELDIKIEVIRRYYGLVLAKNKYEITLNEKTEQDSVYIVTKHLFDIGEKALKEVIDAKANLEQNEYNLKVEEFNVEDARRQLADVMRINMLPYINVDNKSLDMVEIPSFDIFYETIVEKHPNIKYQNAQINVADCNIKYNKRLSLPSITFNYEAGTSGQLFDTGTNTTMTSQWRHNAYQTAQLNILIPVFNHSGSSTQVRKANIERDRAIIGLQKSKQDLRDELEGIYKDLIHTQELLSSLMRTVEMTNEQYEYAIKDYKLGNMASYELNIYKTKRMDAQLRSIQTECELKYKYAIIKLLLD